jgi:hypothetical protein
MIAQFPSGPYLAPRAYAALGLELMEPLAPMLDVALTFIVPVRHQANAKDWPSLKRNLAQTLGSIANQTDSRWRGVVIANHGADLPDMPAQFSVVRVDFTPNPLHDMGSADLEAVYDAFRLDKGRRVLAGLIAAQPKGHVMICDDDDFVSRRLAEFVSNNRMKNGWWIQDGYVWADDGDLLYRYRDFSHLCGTSHIIRADLYGLPEKMDGWSEAQIKRSLGSHRSIKSDLDASGPLEPLPFFGAVYRVGHAGAHSQSTGLIGKYFDRSLLKRPKEFVRRLSRLRFLTKGTREEFFGPA